MPGDIRPTPTTAAAARSGGVVARGQGIGRSARNRPRANPSGSAVTSRGGPATRSSTRISIIKVELAGLFGGWARDAVRNAGLTWATRETSGGLPQRLQDSATLHQAVGVLMARQGLDVAHAQAGLRAAAIRADVPPLVIARVIVSSSSSGPGS